MILGITGGICAGKSTAAGVVAAQGVRVVDCDELSHYLTNYEPSVIEAIRMHFGPDAFRPQGAIDRAALAAIVFNQPARRQQLEHILHPPITEIVSANIDHARRRNQPLAVVAPLLVEAGLHTVVDRLWVISCTHEHQLERLQLRPNVGVGQAQRWVDAQMPMEEKENHADTVIRNDGSIGAFEQEVLRQWRALHE